MTAAETAKKQIRVAIVDDHALVREGLCLVLGLRDEIEVVGEAADRASAFQLLDATRPDVLLLDVALADGDAIPLIPAVRARHPETQVVMVTMHRDHETTRQALLGGAAGYVVKGARSSDLVDAILAVSRGERYLHSSIAAAVVEDSLQWLQRGQALSAREREILSLFAAGQSASEIARSLDISAHTVRRHVANVAEKLGVRGRSALTRYAAEHGLTRSVGSAG